MNKIIAIVGMCGAGKSVGSKYLEEKGFQKVYFGGVTLDKLKEEGLEVNPDNEKMMRERLRSELGMGAFAKILLPKIKALDKKGNVVLDGLYSWDEYKILQNELGNKLILVAIVTDKKIRCQRLMIRKERPLNFEETNKRDLSEIENIAKGGPIAYADYYLENNGTFNDYYQRLDDILRDIREDKNGNS